MRILDVNGNEVLNPDLDLGYLKEEKLFIQHHPAVEAVEEVFHYEYTKYPNGGRDRKKVIDVPAVKYKPAWDEYEDIQRYILYTEEELAQMKAEAEEAYKKSPEYKIAQLEEQLAAAKILLGVE